ncbi:MAG TPA: glycosyltransferase family 2 protein [Polyangia bacterium]|nr:glycosyltransferase family 2 protein [Polyangia bacterium]
MIADLILLGTPRSVGRFTGVRAIHEARSALEAMRALAAQPSPPDAVVFADGDKSLEAADVARVLAPLEAGAADLVIGSRVLGPRARELGLWRRLGHGVALNLIRLLYRQRYTDVGPLRAIRFPALVALGMREPGGGWAVEMQVRAARTGLRVVEVPVSSGVGRAPTARNLALVVYRTLRTIVRYATAR